MKVITPRSAHLTNHEVLSHLQSLRQKYTHVHLTHGPARALKAGNLETVMHEVTTYLTSLPNHDPSTWPPFGSITTIPATEITPHTITGPRNPSPKVTSKDLEKRIAAFMSALPQNIHFEKPELLMMINNRPASQAELYLVVEDVEARMNEEEQSAVLDCVKRFWGGGWGEEGAEGAEGAEEDGYEDGYAEGAEEDGYAEGGGEGEGGHGEEEGGHGEEEGGHGEEEGGHGEEEGGQEGGHGEEEGGHGEEEGGHGEGEGGHGEGEGDTGAMEE